MKTSPSKIFGLFKEVKHCSPEDDLDWISCEYNNLHNVIVKEFSQRNREVLKMCLDKLKERKSLNTIVEIGIVRSGDTSSTSLILSEKNADTKYVGIDIRESLVSQVRNPENNSFGITSDSSNHSYVYSELSKLNIESIDLLIIDGFHSINHVYKDFEYAKSLSKNGIVFLHDTNYHPGPKNLLECVDESIFKKSVFFANEEDWGCAILEKL